MRELSSRKNESDPLEYVGTCALQSDFKKARCQKPAGAPFGAPVELRSARRSAWKGLASGHMISTTFNGQNHFKKNSWK